MARPCWKDGRRDILELCFTRRAIVKSGLTKHDFNRIVTGQWALSLKLKMMNAFNF
jgi:hypothetical protein